MIRVLVVDDSPTAQQGLLSILTSDSEIKVIGTASSGEEAISKVEQLKPDLITMDIVMPGMDGIKTTRAILERYPVPIVIVSSYYTNKEVDLAYQAVEAGAVAILSRPKLLGQKEQIVEFIKTIKAMSQVKVIRRASKQKKTENLGKDIMPKKIDIVAIGASTGGPPVIQTILKALPADFSIPIVVVQHISCGFIEGMTKWLQGSCKLKIKIAEDREPIKAGIVYFAPDNRHMGINKRGCVFLSDAPPEHSIRPSVSFLFRSILESYKNRAIAILLTGMGKDGAKEMQELYKNKAITIAQDEGSCAVFGMPAEAIRLGGVTHVLSPDSIVDYLLLYCGSRHNGLSLKCNRDRG